MGLQEICQMYDSIAQASKLAFELKQKGLYRSDLERGKRPDLVSKLKEIEKNPTNIELGKRMNWNSVSDSSYRLHCWVVSLAYALRHPIGYLNMTSRLKPKIEYVP